MSVTCPNCHATLDHAPSRRTRCPSCGKPIVVRRGVLFTEQEAATQDWVDRLAGLGLSKALFDEHERALSKQFGFRPPVNDTVWRFLNSVAASPDWQRRRQAYLEMADLAESEGKPPKPYVAEAEKCNLLALREQGYTKVKVESYGSAEAGCEACRRVSGRVLSIEEALRTLPVPSVCTARRCRCTYGVADPMEPLARLDDRLRRSPKSPSSSLRKRRGHGCLVLPFMMFRGLISGH